MTTTNPYIHTYYVNLRNGADIRREKQPLASGDKNADVFLVHLQDGGKVVSLDGAAVTGKVIRADGQTVPLAGIVADGAARITLDESCYAVPGEIKLTVTVSAGDVVQSVLIVTMDVQTSETGIVVDNGVIGTLSELLAEIENMRTATQEARETVDAANTALDKTAADAQAAITQAIRDTDAAVTEIREVATQAAPPIVVEADGALVAIGDGGARPVVRLLSSIAAVQVGSGEPSPENVRAITGWDAVKVWRTGRNLLDASLWTSRTNSGITYVNNGDGSVTVTGTNTAATVANHPIVISLTLKPGTYTVSGGGSTADGCYSVVNYRLAGAKSYVYGNKTFEVDVEQTATIFLQVAAGATVDVTLWPMIEAGGSASAFEPYQVAELTAALPETVYGGMLDWASGLLTVTHGLITLDGTEAWASNGGTQYYTTDELPRAGVSAVYPVCTHYPGGNAYTGSIANGVLVSPTKIWLRDARFDSDTAGLQAWFAEQAAAGTPVQIVYQLAEPYTVQIDPQTLDMLKGNNTVWSDCGDTAVSYVVDTKTYVDAHAVGGGGGSVASVNGKTGAVVLNAADVGAMPADAQIVDADAREQIAELSEEKVDKNGAGQVTKENTDFWKYISTENLFNYQDAISGSFINNNDGSLGASAGCCYAYVPINGVGTYHLRCVAATFGKPGAARIPLFDADKKYIKTIKGVETDPSATDLDRYPVSIEITNTEINDGCVYIGYTTYNIIKDTVMIVKGDRYPSKYIPYGKVWTIPEMEEAIGKKAQQLLNPLYQMTAVFDGDSLCNGSSAEDGKSGWAGRIGEKNEMLWHNYAQGGGTIMQTEGKYWIGGNMDTILADFPNLDYLILEGGVNDADIWGDEKIGTFDENDFGGTYDGTTFSGALETLFFKAVTYFKWAKIGYIIPHKQGPSGYERTNYFDRAAEICEKWGIPYIDLWHAAHLDKRLTAHWDSTLDIAGNIAAGNLYTDGQHLTAQGYDVLTPKIEAWMKTL